MLRPFSLRAVGRITQRALVLLLLASLSGPALGQRITGRIVGLVSDTTGSIIPKVEVAATNRNTGINFRTVSDETGYYVIPTVPPGEYVLTVERPGFKKLERTGITVGLDQTIRVNLQLQVGEISDTMTVTEQAPLVSSETAGLSTVQERKQVIELPITFSDGRAVFDFLLLGAGTTSPGGPLHNANLSVNGSRQNTISAMVDGAEINLPGDEHWYLARPPVEEVKTIRTQSGAYSAEFGGFSVLNVETLSGTNNFHGSAYYFYSDQSLTARNFFASRRNRFRAREWGGTVGGPIIRNWTFFNFTYDRFTPLLPNVNISTVPTEPLRQGNFQGFATIFDPMTTRPNPNGPGFIRDPFPNNQIPRDRMDPVALKLMEYWPQPNIAGAASVNNFTNEKVPNFQFRQVKDPVSVKIDQKINDRNQLFARLQNHPARNEYSRFIGGPAETFIASVDTSNWSAAIGDTHTFSPQLVNEFRLGYLRNTLNSFFHGHNEDYAGKVGLRNLSPRHFPSITVGGALPMILGPTLALPQLAQEHHHISDNVTYVRGRHIIKTGLNVKWQRDNSAELGRPSGVFRFSGIFTQNLQAPGAGVGFADFLLGLADSADVSSPLAPTFGRRKPTFASFVQDDVKLRPNLTLNLGLRYERDGSLREVHNRYSNFSPSAINPVTGTPGAIVFAGRDAPETFSEARNNFAPRVGLAYSFNPKTVVRLGGGVNYYANPISILAASTLGFNPLPLQLRTTDQVTPALVLNASPPPVPIRLPELTGAIANGLGVRYIPSAVPTPTFYQWSLSLQRELPWNVLAEAAYVGTRGIHLWFQRDINQVPRAFLGPGDAQSRRPYPQFQGITLAANDGESKYHALQLKLTRRFSSGLMVDANYTLSRNMDNSSTDFAGGSGPYQDLSDLKAEWALSQNDNRHVFNMQALYEVPQWLPKGSTIANFLSRGWQTNGVFHAYSGFPANPVASINQSGALAGTLRPNRLADGNLPASQRSVDRWFDLAAFTPAAPFTFGNSGRNVIRGPGFWQFDFSLFKNNYFKSPLNEQTNLQFRAELLNAFNHPNFRAPNATIGSAAAGTIRAAFEPRIITFGIRFVF